MTWADEVMSSLSWQDNPASASTGSFSQGSAKPAPPGKIRPEAMDSRICLKASPGVNCSPALAITFSQRSSTAWK